MGNQANLNDKSTARQSLARLIEAFSGATVELKDGCVPPIRISLPSVFGTVRIAVKERPIR